MTKKDFLDVPQQRVKTSQGGIDFPLLYQEVDSLFASFWVDREKAMAKLKGTGLVPALKPVPFSNKAVVTISFFEYRKTSAGAYNEVAVAIHSCPEDKGLRRRISLSDLLGKVENRIVGTHIIDLPVTTEWARAGGVEVYGYPKWVAEIPVKFNKKTFDGRVIDPKTKKEVFSLSGRLHGPGIKTKCLDVMSYSILRGGILKTIIDTDGHWKIYRGKGFTLRAGDTSHFASKNIRDLGLDGAEPFLVQRTINFRSILYLGKPYIA